MSYTEFIEKPSLIMWVADFAVLIVVLWFSHKDLQFKSTLVTLLIVVTFDGLMHSYVPELKAFIRENKPPGGDSHYYHIGLFAWYVGFMALKVVGMFTIYRIHKAYNIALSVPSYAYLVAYFCLTFLHAIRYSERLIWGTDVTKEFYKTTVLSINIGVSVTTLVVVLGFAVSRYLIKQNKKGLSWSL